MNESTHTPPQPSTRPACTRYLGRSRAVAFARRSHRGPVGRRAVLEAFAGYADDTTGRGAWPAVATVAGRLGVSCRTVQRHLAALVADGWIREGDQGQVAHLPARRRPIVYDVATCHRDRVDWAGSPTVGRRAQCTRRARPVTQSSAVTHLCLYLSPSVGLTYRTPSVSSVQTVVSRDHVVWLRNARDPKRLRDRRLTSRWITRLLAWWPR